MRKLIIGLMVFLILPLQALADCDFSTGITSLPNGNYEYTKACHIQVGEMKRDLKIALEQNLYLTKALSLKDFALKAADNRATLWMDTSHKLEARIEIIDSLYQRDKWLYFGLGILATGAAIYGAGQLNHR